MSTHRLPDKGRAQYRKGQINDLSDKETLLTILTLNKSMHWQGANRQATFFPDPSHTKATGALPNLANDGEFDLFGNWRGLYRNVRVACGRCQRCPQFVVFWLAIRNMCLCTNIQIPKAPRRQRQTVSSRLMRRLR